MQVGIVGFPGSGKTTIFNALTGLHAETGAGGRTRENVGVIKVPDARVERLAAMSASRRRVYAEMTFVDVAGRPEAAAGAGGGLDRQVVAAMRECEALVLVLRAFANPMVAGEADPAGELDRFGEEMILSDLMPLETRRDRLAKEPGRERERALIERCIAHLEAGRPLRELAFSDEERAVLTGFALLTAKPVLCLLNQAEDAFAGGVPETLRQRAAAEGLALMAMSGQIEMDIAALAPEEQQAFLEDLGVDTSARERFIRASYALLELITFLTTGPEESRAWPIRRGTPAVKAAGKVHSDIERGFIRAEVIAFDDLMAAGGMKQARDRGLLRLEGKTYVVRDGDVVHFRFNV